MPAYFDLRASCDFRKLSPAFHQKLADSFNAQHEVGTRVRAWMRKRGCKPTRLVVVTKPACINRQGLAVVKTTVGYVKLTHIEVHK